MGPVLGPHAHTNCARETRVAEPWLPAPRDGLWGGTVPDTRRPSQLLKAIPPREGLPTPPPHAAPRRACKPKGQCLARTPARPRPQQVSSGPRQPALRKGIRRREST